MRRDQRGSCDYWIRWMSFDRDVIREGIDALNRPSRNPQYKPQYVLDSAFRNLKLMLRTYGSGDALLGGLEFCSLLDMWDESERLGKEVWSKREQELRHSWALNLHFYQDCFWLTGLALTLEIPDEQWQRLIALMGNEGEDVLLDSVIATRQPGRRIGDKLRFPKAYKKLLKVIEAEADEQPRLLREYVEGWYASLKNAGNKEVEPFLRTPYWYTYGDENFEGGAYFGRWCIEAVAVAKAFNIDDSLCLDHPNYPGDLLKDGRSPRYPDEDTAETQGEVGIDSPQDPITPEKQSGSWLSRWFGSKQ